MNTYSTATLRRMAGSNQSTDGYAPPRPYMRVTPARPKPQTGLTRRDKIVLGTSMPLAFIAGIGIGQALINIAQSLT